MKKKPATLNPNTLFSTSLVVEHSSTSPGHYQRGQIQVWDFIVDQDLNFLRGNVVKYLCRAGFKDAELELEDLEKAKAYLEREIRRVSGE